MVRIEHCRDRRLASPRERLPTRFEVACARKTTQAELAPAYPKDVEYQPIQLERHKERLDRIQGMLVHTEALRKKN